MNAPRRAYAATAAVAVMLNVACMTSPRPPTGVVRPRTLPSQVIEYSAVPAVFEQIAVITVHRKTLFNGGGEHSTDYVVERLKVQAAKLGANGLIIEGFEQHDSLNLGGNAGGESYSAHGSISLSIGAFFQIVDTSGTARAIFVPPGSAGQPASN